VAIAAVATISYLGWLCGPSTIGGMAELTNLPTALGIAALLLAVIAVLAHAFEPSP
jgi:hypothetical protein